MWQKSDAAVPAGPQPPLLRCRHRRMTKAAPQRTVDLASKGMYTSLHQNGWPEGRSRQTGGTPMESSAAAAITAACIPAAAPSPSCLPRTAAASPGGHHPSCHRPAERNLFLVLGRRLGPRSTQNQPPCMARFGALRRTDGAERCAVNTP